MAAMKKTGFTLSLLAALVMLSGCESARKAFGNKKTPPDEFVVYKRPPLSLPPEYGLRPPEPGATRPQRVSPTDVARAAVTGQKEPTQPRANQTRGSAGLNALLRDTGGLTADPTIRNTIDQETSILSNEDQRFVDKLIFWVDDKPNPGTVLDPEEEQKRIREAQALGKPLTEGETVHVKRKRGKKGLLDF